MTDDLFDAERALRDVLFARAGDVPPPVGVYAAVRRRHVRRRAVLGTALAAMLVAGVVPVALAANRPEPTAPAAGPCDPAAIPTRYPDEPTAQPGTPTPPADPDPAFPLQSDVRGSLGGDAALVQAVLRAGWTRIRTWAPLWENQQVAARTARVLYVERVGGMIVAGMTASDAAGPLDVDDARNAAQVYVVGRDRRSLLAFRAGGWSLTGPGAGNPLPDGNTEVLSDTQPVTAVSVCGTAYAVVRTRAGATASLRSVAEVRPDATVRYATAPVPLDDGFAIVPAPSGRTDVTVTGAGAAPVTRRLPDPSPLARPLFPDDEIEAAVRAAGGSGRRLVDGVRFAIVARADDSLGMPVSDLRVHALPGAGGRGGILLSWSLPGGARVVVGATAPTPTVLATTAPRFHGLLPAGAVDRTVFAWHLGLAEPGKDVPLAVFANRAVRAEVVRGADVRSVDLTDGGVVLPDSRGVTEVRAYDAAGRLLGTAVPDRGLLHPPGT